MINIMVSGCGGRLGSSIVNLINASDDMRVIVGIDINPYAEKHTAEGGFPVLKKPSDYTGDCDVIIDSSHHTAVLPLIDFAKKKRIPIVIATTGHTEDETTAIKNAALDIPVFFSRNMSVGINLLISLVRKSAQILGDDFNIEIIEKHHNKKLDAPSGTALMLADAAAEGINYEPEYTYDRHSVRRERMKNEIGLHSIRGGTIVGEHDVIFAGPDEMVTLSHSAQSREVFASGAIRAALYLKNKPKGFYNMQNLVDDFGGLS